MPIGNALACIRSQKGGFFNFDIIIDSDVSAWKLTTALVTLGWNGSTPIKGTVTINNGVTVSGTATTNASRNGGNSFTIGTYNIKSDITIINNGTIIGCGGYGGTGNTSGKGGNGGVALSVAAKINLLNNGSIIGGGGGGGSNVGGGGGGAGIPAGGGGLGTNACQNFGGINKCFVGVPGNTGNATTGGLGGSPVIPSGLGKPENPAGGNGGSLGSIGGNSGPLTVFPTTYSNIGGSGGNSVVGWSKVTLDPSSVGTFTGIKTG